MTKKQKARANWMLAFQKESYKLGAPHGRLDWDAATYFYLQGI